MGEEVNLKDGAEIAKILTKFCNGFSHDKKGFVEQLTQREHRTLQQCTMNLFLATIEEWSKQESFDLRNEETIRICKQIMQTLGESYRLPTI